MTFDFEVPGVPVGKAAPRVSVLRGQARAYIPRKSREYMALVAAYFRKAYPGAKPIPAGVAVSIEIEAFYEPPKSWSKKLRRDAVKFGACKTTKPDLSNILKGVEDALSGLAYADDNQVARQVTTKRYAERSFLRVRISITKGGEI